MKMKAFPTLALTMAAVASAQDSAALLVKYLDSSQNVILIPDKSPTASMNWTLDGVFSLR